MSDPKITDPNNRFDYGCFNRWSSGLVQGAILGSFGGFLKIAWYPDPYVYTGKGTILSDAITNIGQLKSLRGPALSGALVCSAFTGVECLVEQFRDTNKESTYVNSAAGGFAAGLVLGGLTRRIDVLLTSSFTLAGLMGMVEMNGQFIQKEEYAEPQLPSDYYVLDETHLTTLKEKYPEYKNI